MRSERGFALVTVVLLMIGLAVLATGLVFAASQHATVVASMHDVARARRGAEAAVAIALERWSAATRSRDPVGATVRVLEPIELEPGLRVSAAGQRLSGIVWIVTGSAEASHGSLAPVGQTAARIVHSADIDSIGRALDAAFIASRAIVHAGASVSGSGSSGPADPGTAALCASWGPAGAAVRAPPDSLTIASGALVGGTPPVLPDPDVARFRTGLGSTDLDGLRAAATPVLSPVVSPAPAEHDTTCVETAPLNWGAPGGPCAALHILAHAPDRLRIDGGYGQGILIADRDLVLDGGFRFRGVIIGLGTVTLRDASIEGVVVAARVEMERGSALLDRCAVAEALDGAAPLQGAHPPSRSWIPTFD